MSWNSARVETCTTRLLNSWHGPNRLAYHGATLRNIRQPSSSPKTSIIRSRWRHMMRTRSEKAGSGGSSISESKFFSLSSPKGGEGWGEEAKIFEPLSPFSGERELEALRYCSVRLKIHG